MISRHGVRWLVTGMAALVLSASPGAQARKAFDGVSIRPLGRTASRPSSSRVSPERFEVVGVTVMELIGRAHGIDRMQFSRIVAPDWVRRDSFDIRAVMPMGATSRDIPEMLQSLLETRFKLTMHVEQRPLEVYELLVLPSGITFREVPPVDDLAARVDVPSVYDTVFGLPGDQVRSIASAEAGLFTITSRSRYVMKPLPGNGAREIDAARISMYEFGWQLRPSLDRPVVDKTGLTGVYQLKTVLPPPRLSPAMQQLLGDRLDTSPSGVSMARALEALGLKLEPKTAPVDVVVVDTVERPTPD